MENFFSKSYFEEWLKTASPVTKDWFAKEAKYLKEHIKPGSIILDVGCGFGRHIQMLAGFSKEVFGVDKDAVMVSKAKNNLKKFSNVNLFLENANRLKFPDGTFDYVICTNNTFGNFGKSKTDILNEMLRVCKRGGEIIISVYSEDALAVRKKDYEKVGLCITEIDDGKVATKEGLSSEQFSKEQLVQIFQPLVVEINKLNPISYICVFHK